MKKTTRILAWILYVHSSIYLVFNFVLGLTPDLLMIHNQYVRYDRMGWTNVLLFSAGLAILRYKSMGWWDAMLACIISIVILISGIRTSIFWQTNIILWWFGNIWIASSTLGKFFRLEIIVMQCLAIIALVFDYPSQWKTR